MGHLTLISEDVIAALERFPPDLRLNMIEYAPTPGWDEYVTGRYNETKKKDTRVLGGGKPVIALGGARNITRWKVDEEEAVPAGLAETSGSASSGSETKGEFRRVGNLRPVRESSADFGPAAMQEEEEEEPHPAPHVRTFP